MKLPLQIGAGIFLLMASLRPPAAGQDTTAINEADLHAFRDILTSEEQIELDQQKSPAAKRRWFHLYWRRHDPTPTTPRNERLEEFYRRLEYVRRWYRAPSPLGFDDRGRIYLRYGRPTDSFVQPMGDLRVKANESWSFAEVQHGLVFDFVSDGTAYRLVDDLRQAIGHGNRNDIGLLIQLYRQRSYVDAYYQETAAGMQAGRSIASFVQEKYFVQRSAPRSSFRHNYKKEPLDIDFRYARFRGPGGTVRLENYYGIPHRPLSYAHEAGRRVAHLTCTMAILDTLLRPLQMDTLRAEVSGADPDALKTGTYVDQFTFLLKPGAFNLALRVDNTPGNNLGILRGDIYCAPFPEKSLAMSDLQLASAIAPVPEKQIADSIRNASRQARFIKRGLQITPLPDETIKISQQLYVYFEIYNLKQSTAGQTRYTLTYTLEQPQAGRSVFRRIFGGRRGRLSIVEKREGQSRDEYEHIAIDLSRQPAGEYELAVTVDDEIARTTVHRTAPIRLRKP